MYRHVNAVLSAVVLVGLAILITWGAFAEPLVRETSESLESSESDHNLYTTIVERVQSGENYYEAAISEQASRGYPVTPSTTVRTPTLTFVVSTLGSELTFVLLAGLVIAAIAAATVVFSSITRGRFQWYGAIFLLVCSLILFNPAAIYVHENWAVLLLLLSLFARRRILWLSIAFALLAVAFRELALPFLFAMAFSEAIEQKFKKMFAWLAAIGIYMVLYFLHISRVHSVLSSLEIETVIESPSWLALSGWPFIVGSFRSVTVLSAAPLWITAVITPLALVGWIMVKNPTALRFSLALLGFIVPFLFIGRPNNNYWALLYAALLFPGLVFSWGAIRSLVVGSLSASIQETRHNKDFE